MKVYEIIIKPGTGFGTPLKGDTIFGHFCWQIAYDETLGNKPLAELLTTYHENPFAVFSSAYPVFGTDDFCYFFLRTPSVPVDSLIDLKMDKKQRIKHRKEIKKKGWMLITKDKRYESFKELEYLNDSELLNKMESFRMTNSFTQIKQLNSGKLIQEFSQPHNTINRLTGTTGEERFAPFDVDQFTYNPYTELVVFVGIDEQMISSEQIKTGLERIGIFGFGKDASTGLGKFTAGQVMEIDLKKLGSGSPNAFYTLSPCVPEKNRFNQMYFSPFTRFGKHGDVFSKSINPFKNPVIMADEGAVFVPKDMELFDKPYIGTAVNNVSKVEPRAVVQGYSLYIPVKVEV